MGLNKLDLNLLKTLLILLQEKNTHRAADRLDTSQPAVSRTLAKLRNSLDDPLFVRQAHGMRLTPKAEKLAIELPLVMSQLEKVLLDTNFEPSTLHGKMRLALNSFTMDIHGYAIFNAIKSQCPLLDVELHNFDNTTVEKIIQGEVIAAINYYPMDISKQLRQVAVGTELYGGICRADHPMAGQSIALHEFLNFDLGGLIVAEFNTNQMLISLLSANPDSFKPKMRCEQVIPLLKAVDDANMVFFAPQSLSHSLDDRFGFIHATDTKMRHEAKLGLIYNNIYCQSAQAKWLEALIRQVIAAA